MSSLRCFNFILELAFDLHQEQANISVINFFYKYQTLQKSTLLKIEFLKKKYTLNKIFPLVFYLFFNFLTINKLNLIHADLVDTQRKMDAFL